MTMILSDARWIVPFFAVKKAVKDGTITIHVNWGALQNTNLYKILNYENSKTKNCRTTRNGKGI